MSEQFFFLFEKLLFIYYLPSSLLPSHTHDIFITDLWRGRWE